MEKDILNYSPTVMFRGTPCSLDREQLVTTLPEELGPGSKAEYMKDVK